MELTRAPGGQLITRIRTEHAAGKLAADVIEYSDRGHLRTMLDMYQEYRPPNADAYQPAAVTDPDKLWPRTTTGWCIAHNTALVDDPPRTWMDLTDPKWKGGKEDQDGWPGRTHGPCHPSKTSALIRVHDSFWLCRVSE